MSRSRYRIFDDGHPYFLTSTIVGWLPVFTRCETMDIVLDSWKYLQREAGLQLYAYVILENHVHYIAKAHNLAEVVKRFKSYKARQIVDLLKRRCASTLLRQLESLKLEHKDESRHQVWQEGNHPQQVCSDEMLLQKLEYIHNNPVKRGYVDDPVHWRYSSARNYARLPGMIDVMTQWS